MADNEPATTIILENRLLAEVQVYDSLYNKYSIEFKDKYKEKTVGKRLPKNVNSQQKRPRRNLQL